MRPKMPKEKKQLVPILYNRLIREIYISLDTDRYGQLSIVEIFAGGILCRARFESYPRGSHHPGAMGRDLNPHFPCWKASLVNSRPVFTHTHSKCRVMSEIEMPEFEPTKTSYFDGGSRRWLGKMNPRQLRCICSPTNR